MQEDRKNAQGSMNEEEEEEEPDGELDSATRAALVKELVELKERKNRLGRLVAELEGYG